MSQILVQYRDKLVKDATQLAADVLGKPVEYKDYLIAAGRYRQMRDEVTTITNKLKADARGETDLPEPNDDFDEPEQPSRLDRARASHRPRPR